MKAVIFLAHGSRRSDANDAFIDLAEEVAQKLNLQAFEVAFVEKTLPSLEQGIQRCVKRGATSILVYPHFLFSGIHLTRDLTVAIETARRFYPHIDVSCTLALGEHPELTGLVSRIVENELR